MRSGDGARRGVTGADENRALEALRWNWGDAYHIGYDGGEWWYRRRDGKGGRESAPSAGELYKLIIDDYTFKPVSRDLP